MAAPGRPRLFVTQAERQKAYRERKRKAQALRNSSGNILETPEPVNGDLLALWNTYRTYSEKHDKLRVMQMYGPAWDAFGGFDEWKRQLNANLELCWKAHDVWCEAWRYQGCPDGPWKGHWNH